MPSIDLETYHMASRSPLKRQDSCSCTQPVKPITEKWFTLQNLQNEYDSTAHSNLLG